jgi:putative ABC transport system substrate-binding protein
MDKKRPSTITRSVIRMWYLIALIASAAMPDASLADSSPFVYIITSPGSNFQTQVSNTLIKELSASDIDAASVPASEITSLNPDDNAIFITFGGSTARIIRQLHSGNAQLNITYDDKQTESLVAHNQSALVLTQPACRQILFMHKFAPAWKSIGIITSKRTSKQTDDIKQCAEHHGFVLRIYHVDNEKELIRELDKAVDENDVLMALADTTVYNSRSVKNILLTAYRHRMPVIGYSNSLVKAGAVAAIYTSAENTGKQAAGIIQNYISSNGCFSRRINTPSEFTVSINHQVARALDIDLDEDMNFSDDLDLLEIR